MGCSEGIDSTWVARSMWFIILGHGQQAWKPQIYTMQKNVTYPWNIEYKSTEQN